MEHNHEMTAQESLRLITETMNNNRRDIVRHSGKYFILWGTLLTVTSLAIFLVPMNVSLIIVIIMGLAECMSGVLLKNWPIIICGFLLGIGGAVFAMLVKTDAQLLIFTLGGIFLMATGLIMKLQDK